MPPPTLEQAIWAFLVDDVALDLCFEVRFWSFCSIVETFIKPLTG